MTELEFSFDELPIITDLGFDAALINGSATIGYESPQEWYVRSINLDGYRERTAQEREAKPGPMIERKSVELCRESYAWMWGAILHQLEHGRFKDEIEAAIEATEEDRREDAGERRSGSEHSTMNRAQQRV